MTDLNREATAHSRRAGNHTRRSVKWAQQAADSYATAARWSRMAARLTQNSGLWIGESTPAGHEQAAHTHTRIGDLFLRMSASEDQRAAESRALAAQYRQMAARRAAWLAA